MGPDRGEESRIPRHRCSTTLLFLIGRARARNEGAAVKKRVCVSVLGRVSECKTKSTVCAGLMKATYRELGDKCM